MKAVILVGGEATRLRPLTCNLPKAMVPVLNTPFLEHVLSHLNQHQVKNIVLAQGIPSPLIEDYFGDGGQVGVRLTYAVEHMPLGTAGAVKNAERYLDQQACLVLNGDIITDLDITDMLDYHRRNKAKVTIALTPVEDPTSYGLIETDSEGRITRFLEKPSWDQVTTNMINAGTYVLEPEVLGIIPPETRFMFERDVFPQLLDRGEPVYGYPSSAYWIDMGTPEKYLQLHQDLLTGKSSRYAPAPGQEVQIGEQSYIHPTAQIKGPAVIGGNCTIKRNARLIGPVVIGAGCTVLSETVIEGSVIWQNCRLGPRANLRNSIVSNDCCLDTDCTVPESVIGDNVTITSGIKLAPCTRIWPGETVEANT